MTFLISLGLQGAYRDFTNRRLTVFLSIAITKCFHASA